MILDLKHFELFPVRTELTDETVRTDVGAYGFEAIKNLKLMLNVQKSDDEYYCQGELEAAVQLECARCLNSFEQSLSTSIDFIVVPQGRNKAKEENVIDDEDYAFYDNELRAELWDIIRQALILAVDIKPLCNENCRGFCSTCGSNLNKKQCDCRKHGSKSQFAELRSLL